MVQLLVHERALRANLHDAFLPDANLQAAILQDANLQRAFLLRANLQDANLIEADLREANLESTNLQDANLSGAKLQRVKLGMANLKDASLFRAKLCDAELYETDLSDVNLENADLREASLYKVKLHGTKLGGANLQGASLMETDLQGALGLTELQLVTVANLLHATMPDGSRYDGRFNLSHDTEIVQSQEGDDEAMARWYGVPLKTYRAGQKWARKNLTRLRHEAWSEWEGAEDAQELKEQLGATQHYSSFLLISLSKGLREFTIRRLVATFWRR